MGRPKLLDDLADDERRAIASLKRLSKRWPKSLWLFSASGTLCVMRCDENGGKAHAKGGCIDQTFIVDQIDIPNDGGDW